MSTANTLRGRFERLCEALGVAEGEAGEKPGLVLNESAGGFIVRYVNKDGSKTDVFGSRARRRADLADVLDFAVEVLAYKKPAIKKPAAKRKPAAKKGAKS